MRRQRDRPRGAAGAGLERLRARVAHEAARIMHEQGVRDWGLAKRKAAERLGADGRALPRNEEIEAALGAYRRLFDADHGARLRRLREAAVEAMRMLSAFEPRLVGSVLSGVAGAHSDVNLHLFSDTPEAVASFLDERRIPYETCERRLRPAAGLEPRGYPAFRYVAGEVTVELTVFPFDGLRQPPCSPVDGRPMRRAGLAAVEALLSEPPGAEPWR